jgi:photosystem II stability/assembly factor-like uncharacterized protein
LKDLFFIGSDRGWLLARYGQVYRTNDGGWNWSVDSLPGSLGGNSLHFVNENVGYVVGDSGWIAKTTNGGSDWDTIQKGSEDLRHVHFTDPDHGWAVGGYPVGNAVYRTTDGGDTWRDASSGINDFYLLKGVHFVDQDQGWVLTQDSLYHTINGGQDWEALASLGSLYPNDLHFVDASEGYIASDSGKVYRSLDSGKTWSLHKEGPGAKGHLFALDFSDPENGWAVGGSGQIFHYGDPITDLSEEAHGPDGSDLLVHPNPVKESVWIEWNGEQKGALEFTLFDPYGKRVRDLHVEVRGMNARWKMELGELSPGVYILRGESKSGEWTESKKLVVR